MLEPSWFSLWFSVSELVKEDHKSQRLNSKHSIRLTEDTAVCGVPLRWQVRASSSSLICGVSVP